MAAIGTMLICLLLFNGAFRYLPMPIIAAMLVFTAIRIMDFHEIIHYYRIKPVSFIIVVLTILCSVFFSTVMGIVVGTVASLLMFIKRATYAHIYVTVFRQGVFKKKVYLTEYLNDQQAGDVLLIKLRGDLNYLNAEAHFHDIDDIAADKTLVLSCEQLLDIDVDGFETLSAIISKTN